MTALEFMKRKNAIIKDITGITLIPDDQLKDVHPEYMKLNLVPERHRADGKICPYCQVYANIDCVGCPMSEANNECMISVGNTYEKVLEKLRTPEDDYVYIYSLPAIQNLVQEYNKQF